MRDQRIAQRAFLFTARPDADRFVIRARNQRAPLVERFHVMKHPARDNRVPLAVELLERALPEAVALRCVRVDTEHVVARVRELRDEPAFAAAPHLEHSTGWRR
jgi:hypothetical protein